MKKSLIFILTMLLLLVCACTTKEETASLCLDIVEEIIKEI